MLYDNTKVQKIFALKIFTNLTQSNTPAFLRSLRKPDVF